MSKILKVSLKNSVRVFGVAVTTCLIAVTSAVCAPIQTETESKLTPSVQNATKAIKGKVAKDKTLPEHAISIRFTPSDFHKVEARFSHSGTVVVDGVDNKRKTLTLNVDAKQNYSQRFTGKNSKSQAIRNHTATRAIITIDGKKIESKLEDESRYVISRIASKKSPRVQMASISNVLKQSELELINTPFDPLTFAKMFSTQSAQINIPWQPESSALATFLSVDRVYENNVQLTLKEVDLRQAKIYLTGNAKAEVDDVSTSMQLNGVALIDMETGMVTELRTSVKEDRKVGQIAPGFNGLTKINMRISKVDAVQALSNQEIGKRTKSTTIERRLKWEPEAGQISVVYDPRWRLIASEKEAAVLRMVDEGQLLAQCNIVQLPSRPANNPLKLAEFQSEVRKIVSADKSARVQNAVEKVTPKGLKALRVQVEGIEEEVAVQWIYYHVAAKDGRRLTFVFTLEKELASRFVPADLSLVNELVFKPATKKPKASSAKRGEEFTRSR